MSARELWDEGQRLSSLLDAAVSAAQEEARRQAEAERDYRKAKAEAWVRASVEVHGPIPHKTAWVDGETADLRFLRDLADGRRRAASDAIRARTAQVSLLMTFTASQRAEMELAR